MSYAFRLLGPVELLRSGRLVPLGPAKQRAMLATLALHANQPVALSALTDAIWAGPPPASATANLRTYATGLRPVLGNRLLTRPHGYQLHVKANELDTEQFTQLATAGRQALTAGDIPTASAHLSAALDLWRGPAGDDLKPGTTLHTRMAALDQQRLDVFEDHIDTRINTGSYAELAIEIGEHLTGQPLRERAWAQLILVLYRNGDVAGALAAYRQARHTLRRHLGIDPGPDLTGLHHAILRRDPALDPPHPRPSALPCPRRPPQPAQKPEIPDSLREFAEEAHLTEAEIRMLAAIRIKGKAPRTPQRWRYIYTAIQTSEAIDT